MRFKNIDGTRVQFTPEEEVARDAEEATFASEAPQRALEKDVLTLRESGKDVALVAVRLTQWILDNTAMTADDFSPEVKQAFLDLRAIADRVDPPA